MTTVAVLGASPKGDRYSNKALHRLQGAGYRVIPVNPGHAQIEGLATVSGLRQIREAVDTVTLYVSSERVPDHLPDLLALKPRRVIFNPGTENPAGMEALAAAGIEVVEGCTLVMLTTGTF